MQIDPKSSVPLFRQIADQLRHSIDARVFRPGEMLPSLRALAIEIKVNPNTVQRAYDALEREGIVETRRGIGIFVVDSNPGKRNSAERQLAAQMLRSLKLASKAGMKPDAMRSVFDRAMRKYLESVGP